MPTQENVERLNMNGQPKMISHCLLDIASAIPLGLLSYFKVPNVEPKDNEEKKGVGTRGQKYIYGHLPEAMREASPKTTSAYQRCPMYIALTNPEII
ncbi:hypothetical protein PV327_000600 [Microctonus hyperodae]|uniref:Uncharacterized protein n=1 Tax=Microctonus hyperodae TaxID=165561 RepID=A0AA39G6I7_MICHY|nr:hypothetical protein PV327_000600 [Microctonus hyperodae]